MLITFEGIDGSGKSTQARRLFEFLKKNRLKASLYREPGGTKLAEDIRSLIMNSHMDSLTELFLFEASRSDLIINEVKPDLAEGKVVILDRFTDSTLAYQGYGRGLELSTINTLNDIATSGLKPNVTFLLDIDPETALGRVKESTRFEEVEFLTRVRQGFIKLAEEDKDRFVVLNSEMPEEEVFSSIVKSLANGFPERFGFLKVDF